MCTWWILVCTWWILVCTWWILVEYYFVLDEHLFVLDEYIFVTGFINICTWWTLFLYFINTFYTYLILFVIVEYLIVINKYLSVLDAYLLVLDKYLRVKFQQLTSRSTLLPFCYILLTGDLVLKDDLHCCDIVRTGGTFHDIFSYDLTKILSSVCPSSHFPWQLHGGGNTVGIFFL